MEETRKFEQFTTDDTLEIVELDERLDMAFDPLSVLTNFRPKEVNINCYDGCCGW
jgi:hypothetical protein